MRVIVIRRVNRMERVGVAKSVVPAKICGTLLTLLLAATGCGGIPKTVTKDEVADQIKQKRWGEMGESPESASCPEDLKPTVGAKVVCEMTVNGQTYTVEVTVEGIDGDTVQLDMQGHR